MEARLNMFVFLSLVAAAALLQGSSAQTTHVVGDDMGWLVPPGGEVAYRTWAAAQTFTVGDVLGMSLICILMAILFARLYLRIKYFIRLSLTTQS